MLLEAPSYQDSWLKTPKMKPLLLVCRKQLFPARYRVVIALQAQRNNLLMVNLGSVLLSLKVILTLVAEKLQELLVVRTNQKRYLSVLHCCVFSFLFCKCFGIPNSPRSLDLDDRQGLIASSAMQQKKKGLIFLAHRLKKACVSIGRTQQALRLLRRRTAPTVLHIWRARDQH